MITPKHCPHCGAALPEGARFCGGCGTNLANAAPTETDRRPEADLPAAQEPRGISWPLLLIIFGGSILFAGLFLSDNAKPERATAPAGNTENNAAAAPVVSATNEPVQEDLPYPEVQRISVSDAKAAFDAGTALFVDTRDAEDFAAGHLPTAVNIPSSETEARHPELSRGMTIITYCA